MPGPRPPYLWLTNCLKARRYHGLWSGYVRLEASTLCQLRCPSCQAHSKANPGILGSGCLSLKDFTSFIGRHPFITKIELSNYGEIFLNPELKEILRHAHEKGVDLFALNGVNLNTVDEATQDALVRTGLQAMTVSIDGASPETYAAYRVGGNFQKVIGHIRRINELKKEQRSPLPRLIWQFVVFGHNEHEIARARAMARELDMDFQIKLNWDTGFSPVQDVDRIRREVGAASIREFEERSRAPYLPMCLQMWLGPQINWDGTLLGCCVNKRIDLGNVFRTDLKTCLAGKRMTATRRTLRGLCAPTPDIPCYGCPELPKFQRLKNPLALIKALWRWPAFHHLRRSY